MMTKIEVILLLEYLERRGVVFKDKDLARKALEEYILPIRSEDKDKLGGLDVGGWFVIVVIITVIGGLVVWIF